MKVKDAVNQLLKFDQNLPLDRSRTTGDTVLQVRQIGEGIDTRTIVTLVFPTPS